MPGEAKWVGGMGMYQVAWVCTRLLQSSLGMYQAWAWGMYQVAAKFLCTRHGNVPGCRKIWVCTRHGNVPGCNQNVETRSADAASATFGSFWVVRSWKF